MAMDKVESIEEVKRAAERNTIRRHEEFLEQEAANAEYSDVEAQATNLQAISDKAVANDTTTDEVVGSEKPNKNSNK